MTRPVEIINYKGTDSLLILLIWNNSSEAESRTFLDSCSRKQKFPSVGFLRLITKVNQFINISSHSSATTK